MNKNILIFTCTKNYSFEEKLHWILIKRQDCLYNYLCPSVRRSLTLKHIGLYLSNGGLYRKIYDIGDDFIWFMTHLMFFFIVFVSNVFYINEFIGIHRLLHWNLWNKTENYLAAYRCSMDSLSLLHEKL